MLAKLNMTVVNEQQALHMIFEENKKMEKKLAEVWLSSSTSNQR
jgi:hypothetical protein